MLLPLRQPATHSRRGTVLLLVVLGIAFALIAGLTFLAGSSNAVGAATIVDDRAQARQAAEAATAMTVAYMRKVPDWRSHQPSGVWTNALEVLDAQAQISVSYAPAGMVAAVIVDPSFELQTASAPAPLLNPPASATIGGWSFTRSALLVTGPTVPTMGTRASASATDGANQAFASFTVAVQGGVVVGQTLSEELKPDSVYEASVDIETSGFLPAASEVGVRVLAGSTLIASSTNAATLADGLSAQAIQDAAQQVQGGAQEPATLLTQLLSGATTRYTLRFLSDASPAPGAIRLEFFANATAVLRTVAFDNVRLEYRSNLPTTITVIARRGTASHRTAATVKTDISGTPRIVAWTEP